MQWEEAVLSWSWAILFLLNNSLNALINMGVKKFPLGRKLESALQLDLDTYKSMEGRGKGRPDCTKLGRGKQHDRVSRCQKRNGK